MAPRAAPWRLLLLATLLATLLAGTSAKKAGSGKASAAAAATPADEATAIEFKAKYPRLADGSITATSAKLVTWLTTVPAKVHFQVLPGSSAVAPDFSKPGMKNPKAAVQGIFKATSAKSVYTTALSGLTPGTKYTVFLHVVDDSQRGLTGASASVALTTLPAAAAAEDGAAEEDAAAGEEGAGGDAAAASEGGEEPLPAAAKAAAAGKKGAAAAAAAAAAAKLKAVEGEEGAEGAADAGAEGGDGEAAGAADASKAAKADGHSDKSHSFVGSEGKSTAEVGGHAWGGAGKKGGKAANKKAAVKAAAAAEAEADGGADAADGSAAGDAEAEAGADAGAADDAAAKGEGDAEEDAAAVAGKNADAGDAEAAAEADADASSAGGNATAAGGAASGAASTANASGAAGGAAPQYHDGLPTVLASNASSVVVSVGFTLPTGGAAKGALGTLFYAVLPAGAAVPKVLDLVSEGGQAGATGAPRRKGGDPAAASKALRGSAPFAGGPAPFNVTVGGLAPKTHYVMFLVAQDSANNLAKVRKLPFFTAAAEAGKPAAEKSADKPADGAKPAAAKDAGAGKEAAAAEGGAEVEAGGRKLRASGRRARQQ